MKLPFLYEYLQKSSIDNKEQILEALVTQDWKFISVRSFSGVNYGDPIVNLESDKGYWLSNIPLDLFSKTILAEELIALNKNIKNKNNKK